MKIKIRKAFVTFLSIMLIFTTVFSVNITVATAAASGSCGNDATWSFNESTGTLTISGTGAVKDYNAVVSKVPWESYKPNIKKVIVNSGITAIGNYCFYNCVNLTSVYLPSTITSLNGSGTMEVSYGCFQGCTSLQTITLPSNLEKIGNCAFKGCTALKTIRFPDSLTTLSYAAFCECTALESVVFGSGLTKTGDNAFYNAGVKRITWGSEITEISMYSFFGCNMTSVDIPEEITSIGLRAFANCSFLTNVTVNNADMKFTGDPCNGSEQSITIWGHKGSTAETYANDKNYIFRSLDACDHVSMHDYISVPATCTETGILWHVCDECGETVTTEVIPALGHDYQEIERVDNTEVDGHIYTTNQCTRCQVIQDVITHQRTPEGSDSKTRYIWVDGYYEYTNSATCTTPGTAKYVCTVEGCKMLGNIQTQETVSVSLTNHNVESYTVETEPTCTEKGLEKGVCTNCGAEQTRDIPATGHSYTQDNLLETIDNTEEDGHIYHVYECQNCHEQVIENEHINWVEGFYTPTVITPARCVIDGLERDTCDICGQTQNVTLKANGQHEWYETSRTEPTCTAVGKIYYACKNCTMTKSEDIAKLGHDYVLVEASSSAPTCTEIGVNYFKCSRCSATKQDTVAKLGHTVDESVYTVIQEATCEEDGSAVSVCTVCGAQFDVVLPSPGHDYADIAEDLTNENKPGHSLVTPTCSVCGTTQASFVRHDEWIDGYYNNSPGLPSSCNVQGYTVDTCTICKDATRKNYLPTLGHYYNVTGVVDKNGIQYRCTICLRTAYFDANDVLSHWTTSTLNSRVINRSGPDNADYSSMLDANGDGIINGKDYVIIYKSAKAQAKAIEDAENAAANPEQPGQTTDPGQTSADTEQTTTE